MTRTKNETQEDMDRRPRILDLSFEYYDGNRKRHATEVFFRDRTARNSSWSSLNLTKDCVVMENIVLTYKKQRIYLRDGEESKFMAMDGTVDAVTGEKHVPVKELLLESNRITVNGMQAEVSRIEEDLPSFNLEYDSTGTFHIRKGKRYEYVRNAMITAPHRCMLSNTKDFGKIHFSCGLLTTVFERMPWGVNAGTTLSVDLNDAVGAVYGMDRICPDRAMEYEYYAIYRRLKRSKFILYGTAVDEESPIEKKLKEKYVEIMGEPYTEDRKSEIYSLLNACIEHGVFYLPEEEYYGENC